MATDYSTFINALASDTGLHKDVITQWVSLEKGVNNNILGVTSGGHLVSYPNQSLAAAATARLINTSSYYAGIRASYGGTSAQQAKAIIASPWHSSSATAYYQRGFASITGNNPLPSGGASTPITTVVGAWGDLVSYPSGHTLTQSDVNDIVSKLKSAGYFGQNGLIPDLSGAAAEGVTRSILTSHVGEPWNKALEDTLQGEFNNGAKNATALGGLANLDLPGAITLVGVILVGITFLILGGIIVLKGPKGATSK